uniref:RT/G2 intron protein n=1 Tax=Caulerpa filiformis TaxID=148944 RepID=B9VLA3_9CHLO|nr:RT/G2 intron protein [Caulerpa filiformis]
MDISSQSLISSEIVFLTGQKNYYIYTHLYNIFKKKVDPQYIMITIFNNFLSQKNKLWILSNLILERKYFLSRIPYFRKQNIYKKNLKTIIQHLCIKDFSSLIQETLGLEYNNIIIRILSHKFYNNQILYDFALTRGLNIQFNKTYPYSSIFFLGWFFDGKIVNIRSHQKEFQKFLNKSQISRYTSSFPLDQIIFELNKKIHHWRNFYNEPNLSKIMNDYFFWRIWFWLKKRHKKKGSKWLYEKYWNQSTSRKWILSSNNEYLILLKK